MNECVACELDDYLNGGMYRILIGRAMLSGLRIRRHAMYQALPTWHLRVGRFGTGLGNTDLLSVEIDHPHHASTYSRYGILFRCCGYIKLHDVSRELTRLHGRQFSVMRGTHGKGHLALQKQVRLGDSLIYYYMHA